MEIVNTQHSNASHRTKGLLRPCPVCTSDVDPIRAPYVAHIDGSFRYYCSKECYAQRATVRLERSLPSQQPPKPEIVTRSALSTSPGLGSSQTDFLPSEKAETIESEKTINDPQHRDLTDASIAETVGMLGLTSVVSAQQVQEHASVSPKTVHLPLTTGDVSGHAAQWHVGLVVCVLACAISSFNVWFFASDILRTVIASLMFFVVIGVSFRAVWLTKQQSHGYSWLSLVVPALLFGGSSLVVHPPLTSFDRLASAAWLAAGSYVVAWTMQSRRRAMHATAESITSLLPEKAVVVRPTGEKVTLPADSVSAGEIVEIMATERSSVDGVVQQGQARVSTFREEAPHDCTVGDSVLAGDLVEQGSLQVLSVRAGKEVARARINKLFTTLSVAPKEVQLAYSVEQWGPLASVAGALGVGAVYGFLGKDWVEPVVFTLAVTPTTMISMFVKGIWQDGYASAVRNGVVFRDVSSMSAASRVGAVVLSGRGTVTQGSLEVADVLAVGKKKEREIIAIAAAVEEAAREDPIGRAIQRAASARGLTIESVRRPVLVPGRGITAINVIGQSVVVGSRQLLLTEKISVAPAEELARMIESQGRIVVFVAVDGRVEGILGLQDNIREEARSAAQSMMDAGLELALLAGESRGTVEALGLSLDITNVRPEVSPDERAHAVKTLAEVSGSVAVIGRPDRDASALGAADVAISLRSAGVAGAETAIALATDDLRYAAHALRLARTVRKQSQRTIITTLITMLVALLLVAAFPMITALGVFACLCLVVLVCATTSSLRFEQLRSGEKTL